jgi:hypothetical protein
LLGNDLVLVQELPEVAVRLKDARTALRLEVFLESTNNAFNQRRESHDDDDLENVV